MMNRVVYLLFSQFLLILLQLTTGSWGWTLPRAELGALCIVLSFRMSWGVAAALLNSMILSTLYGGGWNFLYILINPLLAGGVGWWIGRHVEDIRLGFWSPGAWAGLAGALPALAALFWQWGEYGVYNSAVHWMILRTIWSVLVSAGCFVALNFLNEALTEFLGLPRFLLRKGRRRL